ncbi:hypothetical protein A6R68_08876 [Neotoma lepida]|uniref:Mediator of RNA polymerase II transcription subunit 9 n=1 Tax=Neotoma lepida TaxID=56216 RepID=A0A1A6G2H0_NEOLE|nr:hypothetical protein A6R68_08876 [Neotoma lepida]
MDKDSPDLHQDLNALKTKFQEMRKLIGTMPGIHVSPEQQQQQLHSLREQVRTKNELLQKYKSLCMFEIPKDVSQCPGLGRRKRGRRPVGTFVARSARASPGIRFDF